MRIRVDHRAQRQLGDGGPWIFWRPRADGTREGLVLELLPCDNRECECRDVRVNGHLVDENLVEIHSRRGGLVLTYGGGAPARSMTQAVAASISFETGDVEAATEDAQTADHDRVLAWILDELDGELLDRLYDEWLHAKGWRRRDTHEEGAWAVEWRSDTGRLVGWHEAFPDSRQDVYGSMGPCPWPWTITASTRAARAVRFASPSLRPTARSGGPSSATSSTISTRSVRRVSIHSRRPTLDSSPPCRQPSRSGTT